MPLATAQRGRWIELERDVSGARAGETYRVLAETFDCLSEKTFFIIRARGELCSIDADDCRVCEQT